MAFIDWRPALARMRGRIRARPSAWAVFAFAACAAGCVPRDLSISRVDSMVSGIRARQDSLLSASIELSGQEAFPSGTELIARSDSSGVRKIEMTAFGDLGKTAESYYFKDGTLAYCERRQWRLDEPSGVMTTEEADGYYFRDDKLFGSIDLLSGKRRTASPQLANEGPPLVERAYLFLRASRPD